ncbi:MAG: MFS transporter [Chloroflexi bacterium]|nr:MFS transporter [Chloroflexota bacterium]
MVSKITTWYRSWIWLLVLFSFGTAIESLFFGQLRAFTPLYLPTLGVLQSDVARWTGIIAAITGLIGIPFLPFWGALADRYQRKPIIVRSYMVYILIAAILLPAQNVWLFLVGRSLSSFALGNSGLMLATLSERTPASRQGLAISLMSSMGSVGAFLGPLVGGPIVDHVGFRPMLVIDAGLILIVVLAMTFGYRDHYTGTNRGPLFKMAKESVGIIVKSPRLRTLFAALFLLFASMAVAQTYVPLAIQEIYTGSDVGTVIGIILGASGMVAIIISMLFGGLADRYGYWQLLLVGTAAEVVLWPLPAIVKGIVPFTIAWALINGLSAAVFAVSMTVLVQSTTSEVRGRVMSFAYLPSNLGSFLGPAIGSVITQRSIFTIFPVASVFVLGGMVLLVLAKRQRVEAGG